MENKAQTLEERIKALRYMPTEALVAKVLELHSRTVSDSTIRKAFRELDKEELEKKRLEKAEKRAADERKKAEEAKTAAAA